MTTALAFAAFADAPVDVATVEVGLGGAWDATNVLHAGTCVITPIGLDHTELLGDTVGEIAVEKAGIIHSGATVIVALQEPDALEAIAQRCAEVGATMLREGVDFGVVERFTAVGGQVLTAARVSAATTTKSSFRCTALTRPRTPRSRSPPSRRSSAASSRSSSRSIWSARASPRDSPGRLERDPQLRRRSCWTPRTTRTGWRPRFGRWRKSSASAAWSASFAVLADKDAEGELAAARTRTFGHRHHPQLLAAGHGGTPPGRVGGGGVRAGPRTRRPQLPDAIERAVTLAEEDLDGELGGVGVLITGRWSPSRMRGCCCDDDTRDRAARPANGLNPRRVRRRAADAGADEAVRVAQPPSGGTRCRRGRPGIEALVLLLAIVPLHVLGVRRPASRSVVSSGSPCCASCWPACSGSPGPGGPAS